jgi:hypothetical protein
MNDTVSAGSAKPSSDLLRLLSVYARPLAQDQVRLQHALNAHADSSVIASSLHTQRKLVDELHGKVSDVPAQDNVEREAKPWIMASLHSTSQGLARLEAGYRADPGDPSHPHRADTRKHDFAASVSLFKHAQSVGADASHKLGLS